MKDAVTVIRYVAASVIYVLLLIVALIGLGALAGWVVVGFRLTAG